MMRITKTGGLTLLGVFAIVLALARPAVAADGTEHQIRAQAAIAKAETAREGMNQAQAPTGLGPARRRERLLLHVDSSMARANRYYEAGRYADAAEIADEVSSMLARAAVGPTPRIRKEVQ